MQEWRQRPIEIANLFNPAFCAILIAKAGETYLRDANRGLEFALVHLILPIVLHQETRSALPRGRSTTLLAWIESHQALLIGFSDRVRRLDPVTREAVLFGLSQNIMRIDQEGRFLPGPAEISTTPRALNSFSPEVQECIRKSAFLGRWFSGAGTASTILASWGIAP